MGILAVGTKTLHGIKRVPLGLVDEPKVSLYGRETDQDLRSACRCVAQFYLFSPNEQCGGWGGGYAARLFLLFSFPCSADHEQDWPPCKVIFFRVGNQYAECEKQQRFRYISLETIQYIDNIT